MSHSIVNEFVSVVRNDKYANEGGCLFYCLALYRLLKMNNADMTKFNIYQWGRGYDDNIRYNTEWIDEKVSGSDPEYGPSSDWHFFWEWDGVKADAFGLFSERQDDETLNNIHEESVPLELIYKDIDLTEEFCVKALNIKQWNWNFNRNNAIKVLKDTFNIDMSDINKSGY